jgi:hypothetical protein
MKIASLSLLLLFSLTTSGFSQTYQVNGAATAYENGLVKLTPQTGGSVGSAWSSTKADLSQPFDMTFDMFFGCDASANGGDGITFTFQNQGATALGAAGGNLGLFGITPALSIEFDTYDGTAVGGSNEIPADHIAIDLNGAVNNTNQFFQGPSGPPVTVQAIAGGRDLENCAINANNFYTVRIKWDPVAKTLQLYEEGVLTMTYTNDLVANVFGGTSLVYWGFTAATGAASNEQWIAPTGTVIPWACTSSSCCAPFTVTPTSSGSGCNFTVDAGAVYAQYSWSNGASTQSSAVSSSGTYTVNVIQMQGGTACPGSGSVNVVSSAPTATLSGSGTICNDGVTTTPLTVTLTGTPNWTLVYAIDGVAQPPVTGIASSPYTINGMSQHTYTLVSVSDGGGCAGTVSGSSTVNATSGLPIGHNNTFAAPSGSTTLTVDNGGGTYEWHSGSCAGPVEQTGTSYTTPTLSATTTYYVKNTALTASSTKYVALSSKTDPAAGVGSNPAPTQYGLPKADNWLNFTALQNFTLDRVTLAVHLNFAPWVSSKVSLTIRDNNTASQVTIDTAVVAQPASWVTNTDKDVFITTSYSVISGHSYTISYECQNSSGGLGGSMQGIMFWNLVTLTPTPYHITKDAELDITQNSPQTQRYPGLFNWKITAGSPAFSCGCTPVVAEMITTLPVSFLDLTGKLQPDGNVILQWATASETNNNYFTVQSSPDGIHFTDLKNVPGSGSSNSIQNYSATDQPASGITYYRIRQTDYNGDFSYSQIISVSSENPVFAFHLFPNPSAEGAETFIDIQGASANENLNLVIYDLLGRTIFSMLISADQAGHVHQSLSNFQQNIPAGSYVAVMSGHDGLEYKQKFVVMN